MRRIALALGATVILALGTAGSASADTPGCIGQFVAFNAQDPSLYGAPNLGQFLSGVAQQTIPFGTNPNGGIPSFKELGCG